MNLNIDSLKCKICHFTIRAAILLPCEISICKKHLNKEQTMNCFNCESVHSLSDNDICPNFKANHIIDSLTKLEAIIPKIKQLIERPTDFIDNFIDNLKNKIDIKREEIKLEINNALENIIKQNETFLDESENFKILKYQFFIDQIDSLSLNHNSISNQTELLSLKREELFFDIDESCFDIFKEFDSFRQISISQLNDKPEICSSLLEKVLLIKKSQIDSLDALESSQIFNWKFQIRDFKFLTGN